MVFVEYSRINFFVVDATERCKNVFCGSLAVWMDVAKTFESVAVYGEECRFVVEQGFDVQNCVAGGVGYADSKPDIVILQDFVATFYYNCCGFFCGFNSRYRWRGRRGCSRYRCFFGCSFSDSNIFLFRRRRRCFRGSRWLFITLDKPGESPCACCY